MSRTVEVRLNFTAETSSAEQALNKLQSSLRNISTQTNLDTGGLRFTNELNQASEAAIKLRQNLQNAINTNTNKLDLSKFQREMDKSGMSLEKYRLVLQQIGPSGQEAFTDLSKAILASQTPLTRSLGLFDKLWDTLKRTAGWQISSNIMHGLQSALSDAYDYAQDLNRSLNDIRIVTGYGADRMADFAKQANKAAKELSATTLDYTDASLIYYQQGLDDKAVKERTDTTIKMANVTGTTAQTVSQQMTAVWENFMKDGQHATEYYADVMTALGAATSSSTDEIADGLEKFAAVADTVGLSYEYATAALTTITAKTRQSADVVGTALKTLFARIEGLQLGKTLEDGTTLNKYSTALEAVGVNIKDDTGNLKDMDDILDEIGSKWETLSKDQQVALAQTVAGVRQYTQFVALMDNWDFMGENLATAYGAEGTLEEQQKIYEESWKAARSRLQASMETLYDDLLKDDFFIWLTDALSDVVGLIDKIVDSMGGLAGLLPGLILLMNKLWGDKIISGISTVAYNIGGLIPSVNSKRQEADLALKNKTMAEWKIMQDEYQGNLNNSASKASYQAYSQISKIEETRLRLGKGITEQQTAILDTYREQLELLEKVAKTQGQQVDATRKERVEAEAYMSLLQDQTEQQIKSRFTAKYRAGAGSAWLNAVGANYKKGMDISSIILPQEKGAAAKGILKYLNESTGRQVNWEDVQAYSSGNTANENYDAISSAIERLRDRSDEAERSVARLNEILKFSPSSGKNSGELQKQAELIGTIEGIAPQLENIKTRMSNIGVGEESGENIAKLTSRFRELLETVGYSEDELEAFDEAIDNNKTDIALLTETLGKYLINSSDSASITNKLTAAEKDLNNTLSELVTKYDIAPEAVTRLRNALQNYARTATNAEGVTEALKNAIKSTNAGLLQMGQSVDKIQRIQNITTAVTSLAMGISSLKSGIDTISNPDLSVWDKFIQVGFSAGMVFGSFRSFFKELKENSPAMNDFINSIFKLTDGSGATDQLQDLFKYTDGSDSRSQAELRDRLLTSTGLSEETVDGLIDRVNILQASALEAGSSLTDGLTRSQLAGLKLKVILNSLGQALKRALPIMLLAGAVAAFKLGVSAFKKMENAAQDSADALRAQANTVSDAYKEAQEAQSQFASNLDNYKKAKTGLAELTEGTTEYKEKLLEANAAALELIQNYNNLKYSINSEGLIEIDKDSLEQAQENLLKQTEYMQWSAMGSRITADQAQTQADIVKTSRNMDTSSDYNTSSSSDKAIGIGMLTGGATAALIAAGIATFLTGGLAAVVIAAAVGAVAGGLTGYGIDASQGTYSQGEIDAINALSKATSEQWATVQAEAAKADNEKGFLAAVSKIDGLENTSEDVIKALYNNFDAVSKNVASLQANTEALKVWAQGAASGANQNNEIYQSLDEKDQAIADIVISNKQTLDSDKIRKNAMMQYGYLYGATSATIVGIDSDDEEKYLKYRYGDDWKNYRLTDTAGGGVTIQKRDKNNGDAWADITGEDAVDKQDIALALAEYDALQMQDSDKEKVENVTSYRDDLLNTDMDADIVEQVLQDYARNGKWNSSYFTKDQWSAFDQSEDLYDENAYVEKMSELGNTILEKTAERYEMSKEALEAYTKQLVENSNGLYKNYKQAAEATARHIKFAKAVDALADTLNNELDILKTINKNTPKTTKQLESMSKVSQKLADIYGVEVSESFYDSAENLQLLEQAAGGSMKALQKLGTNILKDFTKNFNAEFAAHKKDIEAISQTDFDNAAATFNSGLDLISSKINDLANGTSLADVFDGASLTMNEWLDALNTVALASGWTKQQMLDNLNAIGAEVDPLDITETEVMMPTTVVNEVTDQTVEKTGSDPDTYRITSHTTQSTEPGIEKPIIVAQIGKGADINVDKSSLRNAAGSIGGGSKSSGGGGGGSKKDKKKASDEIERYHVVKQQLDRLSSEYDRLSAAKDRAYGPDKLKAIDKEIAKLKEQEAIQKRYLDEIERYYQQDRAAIAKYGAIFDANGIITNYDALMQKQLDIFNASLTDEAEEAYNAFKEALDQYEETLALKLEESGNLLDKQYEIVSAKLEKITYKVEYKIEIEDDKLDYLERRLTRLSEVEKASLQVFAVNQDKIMSYWIQYATYAEAIKDIEEDINAQKAKGLEITNEQIQKLQDYKNSMSEIEDNIYDLYNDEIDSISDRYSNLFDQLENYQDRIRDYRDSLETIKDMYSLLGVATVEDNRAMNDSIRKTYQAEAKGIQNEIDLLKARREELDKSRDSLGKSVDDQGNLIDGIVADIKQLEDVGDLTIMEDSTKAYSQKLQNQIDEIDQQVHEKQMELISLASDYLNAIKDQWINNLELIGQKTKDALYEGLEWAIDKYGDLTDLSELYLSNTRKIYELNKLNRNIQADINKIDSVAAKTKLRDLMKDINGYYADNVKMSEYELKNLQAQYELRLAEIALEDARNAKSEVRLTRDNEGRWGYMYTANTEEVDKAEQELEDKRYELQQLQEDTLKDAGEKILSLQNDYIDAMTELQSSDLSDEQKKKRAEELTSLYQKQLDYYYKTYSQALQASGLAYEETILGQATNTKSLQEVVETFGHASIEMADQMISETQKYQEAFTQMVSDITGKQINSYEEAQKAWMEYMSNTQKALNEATAKATNNFNEVAKAIQNMSKEFKKLIDELIVYLARLSGEDMSLLFYSALANGDYEMAERYAKARRQKIDSNPDAYGQYDWDTDKMNQIINEKQNKDTPISQEQREAILATAKEPYSAKTDWSLAMRNALSAGEYDKAGQYAEYRAYKVHNDASLKDLAWTEAQLQAEIDRYAQDVSKMSPEQKRRILATASQYDTGGYTGSWGNEGRWALLHEKELVLNKNDTSNLLTTITLLHDLMARLDQASAWSAFRELTPVSAATTTEILEQNVRIEASFPNVTDHNEIEQAFENIVNLASQYANRK